MNFIRVIDLVLSLILSACAPSFKTERVCQLGNTGSTCLYITTAKHPLSGNLVAGVWQDEKGDWMPAEVVVEPSLVGTVTGALGGLVPVP